MVSDSEVDSRGDDLWVHRARVARSTRQVGVEARSRPKHALAFYAVAGGAQEAQR